MLWIIHRRGCQPNIPTTACCPLIENKKQMSPWRVHSLRFHRKLQDENNDFKQEVSIAMKAALKNIIYYCKRVFFLSINNVGKTWGESGKGPKTIGSWHFFTVHFFPAWRRGGTKCLPFIDDHPLFSVSTTRIIGIVGMSHTRITFHICGGIPVSWNTSTCIMGDARCLRDWIWIRNTKIYNPKLSTLLCNLFWTPF